MNKNSKGFSAILILAILFLVIVFWYFVIKRLEIQPVSTPLVSPTIFQDSTTNWKTYVSNVNNFEFKYPSDWEVKGGEQESEPFNGLGRLFLRPTLDSNSPLSSVQEFSLIQIELTGSPIQQTLDNHLNSLCKVNRCEPTNADSILVGGLPAKRINLGSDSYFQEIAAVKYDINTPYLKTGFIAFTLHLDQKLYSHYGESQIRIIFDQILSTFKFID